MFVIYIEIGESKAVYHSEYNSIEACRDAMIELSESGRFVHFSNGYLGQEIRVI